MTTGKMIREERKKAGLTQGELGERLGVSGASIGQYETGIRKPKIETLNRIAKALCIPISRLSEDHKDIVTDDARSIFVDRLCHALDSSDLADILEVFDQSHPLIEIIDGSAPLTIDLARRVANETGLSLDYLFGRVDDPEASIASLSLGDFDLEFDIQLADDDLIECVHRICGMKKKNIPLDYAAGQIREVWDPRKIRVVIQYLADSAPTIQKLLKLEGVANVEEE